MAGNTAPVRHHGATRPRRVPVGPPLRPASAFGVRRTLERPSNSAREAPSPFRCAPDRIAPVRHPHRPVVCEDEDEQRLALVRVQLFDQLGQSPACRLIRTCCAPQALNSLTVPLPPPIPMLVRAPCLAGVAGHQKARAAAEVTSFATRVASRLGTIAAARNASRAAEPPTVETGSGGGTLS